MNAQFTFRCVLLAFVACGMATALEATTHYWVGKEGTRSWHDAANWSPTSVPVAGEACLFECRNMTGPVDVTYDGSNAASHYWAFYAQEGVTENDGTFEKAVYLLGGGATHTLDSGAGINVGYRRKLAIDNLTIRGGGGGYFYVYGHVSLLDGADMNVDSGSYFVPGFAGSRVLIDNASYVVHAMSPNAGGGKFVIRHGGSLQWNYSWDKPEKWAPLKVDFTTGRVRTGVTYPIYNYTFLPKRPGGVLVSGNGGVGAAFYTTGDVTARLGGELWCTNQEYTTIAFTNSATLYGRGKVFSRYGFRSGANTSNRYDLSEVAVGREVGHYTETSSEVATSVFFGDTLFTPCRETSTGFYLWDNTWLVGGTKTFDLVERFNDSGRKRALSFGRFYSNCRSKTVFRNLASGSVYLRDNNDTYGALELGEDSPMVFNQTSYYYLAPAFDGLKMGPGSSIKTAGSMYNYVKVYGETAIDPTAKIIRQTSAKGEGAEPYALLSTYDDDATEPTFEMTTASAGFSVQRVGGSFFYGDGKYKASPVYGAEWTGEEDGLWSNANNWGGKAVLTDRTMYFTGFRNTVVTNDLDNMQCWKLLNGEGNAVPGPFIIRGNPIIVDAGDHHICAYGMYPFIIEADIIGPTKGDFWVSGRGNNVNPTPVVLRGTTTVADGSFSPDGQVVVQGTVNAKDLHFRNWTGKTVNGYNIYWATKLRLEKGGVVNITDQTTVNSATGTFFIANGGAVNITGDLKWATVADNEHCVRGELNVSGALGGVTQAFYGEGVVRAATLEGDAGASLKIGEGVTLVTTTAGTTAMPVVMSQGDATIAPAADLTLAGGVRVDALGRTLTVDSDCAVTIPSLTGYDFDFVKKGAGRLQLVDAPGLAKGYATVEKGTLAITKPTTMGQFTAAAGTTLEFVAEEDGNPPLLTLGDDIDLTGVNVKLRGNLVGMWQTLMQVGEDLEITGTPTVSGSVRMQIVRNADDTMSLKIRRQGGLIITIR